MNTEHIFHDPYLLSLHVFLQVLTYPGSSNHMGFLADLMKAQLK